MSQALLSGSDGPYEPANSSGEIHVKLVGGNSNATILPFLPQTFAGSIPDCRMLFVRVSVLA
jgi:hypothetical protein